MQQFRNHQVRKATKQMEQIFTKYHELLNNLNTSELLTSKNCSHRRIMRKNVERSKKTKRYRKLNYRLRQFGSALFDVMENNKQELFTCPICRNVLNIPVTIECGHTFCYDCLNKLSDKCCECLMDFGLIRSTNVLVQEIVNKWRENNKSEAEYFKKIYWSYSWCAECINHQAIRCKDNSGVGAWNLLDLEPRYCLRSRYAGLTSRSGMDENNIDKAFIKFFRISKRNKYIQSRSRTTIDENINFEHLSMDYFETNSCPNENIKRIVNKFFVNADHERERLLKTYWNHITLSDLECILCSQCYLDPVTTACGHTFCRDCLARVLDHGLACPLCMSPLNPTDQSRGTTYVLDQALKLLIPRQYEERLLNNSQEIQILEKECEVPVFVCTNAFPGVACPLYVYEPRYRLLARRCLQSSSRSFAMAARTDNDRFASYGTILEVKDAVQLHDGRSILTTVGLRRFKVLEKGEKDGYDTAKIQYIRDNIVASDKLHELVNLHQRVYNKAAKWVRSLTPRVLAEVESSIGQMPQLETNWPCLPDGPAWAWWLMPILPLSSQLQVGFLSTTNLEKRLRAIDKMLEHMKIRMKALERNTMNCTDADDSGESCRFWLL